MQSRQPSYSAGKINARRRNPDLPTGDVQLAMSTTTPITGFKVQPLNSTPSLLRTSMKCK